MRSAKGEPRAWIFTNHSPLLKDSSRIRPEDGIIAVDKGLEYIHDLGLIPTLIIGDFDSLSRPELLETYSAIPTLRLKPDKNATDTEHALDAVIAAGFRKLIILNDLGGRFDHALALLRNLEAVSKPGIDCRIETGSQLLFLLEPETRLDFPEGTLFSILALSPEVRFSSSKGLEYPLHDLVISNYQTRGISNLITRRPAFVVKEKGSALAVLTIL